MSLCRCGLSAQVPDSKLLSLALGEVAVPLPAEVKTVGSETERVVPLEELSIRALYHIYHQHTKGERSPCYVQPVECRRNTHLNCSLFSKLTCRLSEHQSLTRLFQLQRGEKFLLFES